MRAVVQRPFTFGLCMLATALSGRAFAQSETSESSATASAEPPEEVTVRGRKTTAQYRLELEQARDEIFRIFNAANEGEGTDITCKKEQPTGSRMRQSVCRTNAENNADSLAARAFLDSLFSSAGLYLTYLPYPPSGGPQVNAAVGTGKAQADGTVGEADALAKFEEQWRQILSENRELYRAVVHYAELEEEYNHARGATNGPTEQDLTVVLETPAATSGPQCEASTLTEYQQRNNVARVTGTVSISMCPTGTFGSFTLVARVRNDAGEIKSIEFSETWARGDAQDHTFNTDYPIGDNVELMNVRVRGLKCTCADPAQ